MKKLGWTMIIVILAVVMLALYSIKLFYFTDSKIGAGTTKEIDIDNLNKTGKAAANNPSRNNNQIKIEYDLPKSSFVVIKIIDAEGKELMSLVNKHEQAGYHFVSIPANNLLTGFYSYRIQAGDYIKTGDLFVE